MIIIVSGTKKCTVKLKPLSSSDLQLLGPSPEAIMIFSFINSTITCVLFCIQVTGYYVCHFVTCLFCIHFSMSVHADWPHPFYLFTYLFVYLFVAALGLCCCAWAFSCCGERGLLFVAMRGLLIALASRCRARALGAWASVVVACRLSSCGSRAVEHRLSGCGTWAWLLRGMWDHPGPGLEPVSPALSRQILNHCATRGVLTSSFVITT